MAALLRRISSCHIINWLDKEIFQRNLSFHAWLNNGFHSIKEQRDVWVNLVPPRDKGIPGGETAFSLIKKKIVGQNPFSIFFIIISS